MIMINDGEILMAYVYIYIDTYIYMIWFNMVYI
jgi:hypothetical protein